MKVSKEHGAEHGANGLVIEAENKEESEFIKYLWCNRTKVVAFENKKDGCSLTIAPTPENDE